MRGALLIVALLTAGCVSGAADLIRELKDDPAAFCLATTGTYGGDIDDSVLRRSWQYLADAGYYDDGQDLMGEIPEPGTMILLGFGLLGSAVARMRRKR